MANKKKVREVEVEVREPGDHTMEIPKGTEELVEELFQAAGLRGKFLLFLGQHIKGTAHIQGISVRGLYDGRVIKLRVQPGDNTTCHLVNYTVIEPADPEEILRRLKTAESQVDVSQKKTRLEKKMRRLFRLVRGCDFKLGGLPADVYREVGFPSPDDFFAVLRGLARNSFFVTTDGEDTYAWTRDMRAKMSQLGFETEEAENRDSVPTEQESEEDRILMRILEIDGELEAVEAEGVAAESELNSARQVCQEVGEVMAALMRQVEATSAAVEAAKRKETDLMCKKDELETQLCQLNKERADLDTRLGELDQAQKISKARRDVEMLLAGLRPEERDILLNQLSGNGANG